ncbi:MAG: multiheme c-type cytochrome [Planctomycetota bacterium]|nr:multiheme c-type cytochrome [Planctomycetota bacterium]
MKRIALIAIVSLVVAGCGGGSSGTPPVTTGINGLVSASGGGALDDYVMLTLVPTGGGAPITFPCANDGTYTRNLPAGDYQLSADRPGYDDYPATVVTVPTDGFLTFDFALLAMAAGAYVGSDGCAVCHPIQHDISLQSGHPYKVTKVEGGVPPTYPFTDISPMLALLDDTDDADMADPGPGTDNPEGTPTSWNDITYVIGGYHWKARLIGLSGEIVTGTTVQYNFVIPGGNLTSETMSSYTNNNAAKSYSCGNCHTTGWMHEDGVLNPNRQDGLAGMDGTFEEGGVRCEACHGAGSTHAQTMLAADITLKAEFRQVGDFTDGSLGKGKPIHCGECHTRDGERDYPTFISAAEAAGWTGDANWPAGGGRIAASGGLVKHHEQYDEILGLDPNETAPTVYGVPFSVRSAGFAASHGDCTTCHLNTHASTVNRNNPAYTGPPGVNDTSASCMVCHPAATYDPANNNRGSMLSLECADCHMPKTAKSATLVTLPNGVTRGDVTSHIFGIDLSGAPAFTTDGKFRYPYLTLDQACRQCHYAGGPGLFDVANLPGNWASGGGFHPAPP